MDLSYPTGINVKNAISGDNFTLFDVQVNDAQVAFIKQEGHGVLLAKNDICDAYHLAPVHTEDR